MTPSQHVTVSLGSGMILGLTLRSWMAGLSCRLVGIFIDLDHLFDFWINRGFSLNVHSFLDFCYHGTSRRFYDILHGYEYLPLYFWLTRFPALHSMGWILTVGYALHLLGDQLFNRHLNRWSYFLAYRLYHGFDAEKIVLRNPFTDSRPT